jgi:tRNA modification GTPase
VTGGSRSTDTIFALSSARGRAGVAVVRLSGPQALPALRSLTAEAEPPPRKACLKRLRNPRDGRVLDQALVLSFPGPASFTGEDVVELHLHGGPAVVQAVLAALEREPGLRPAEAGEFTRRAFDNDKLDLSEVEGLADLIAAETEAQRRQALRQMEGVLSGLVEGWRERLLQAGALAEAMIDFSDEELPADLTTRLDSLVEAVDGEIAGHIEDHGLGERLRHGFQAVILGPPNAGKSSLLNALVRREAAIVTASAGTTRDVIEVHLDLDGYPVTLADTAGLRSLEEGKTAPDLGEIEREGMRRARDRAEDADLLIAVFDLGELPDVDPEILALLDERATVVLNKGDLYPEVQPDLPPALSARPVFTISAKEGTGLEGLLSHLRGEVGRRFAGSGEAPVITRARHRRALEDCRAALARMRTADLPELAAEDLRSALAALERITGRSDVEDILGRIFQEFCIGK